MVKKRKNIIINKTYFYYMKKINKQLVYLYSENPRARLKEMASMLKKSPQLVKYSLLSLKRQGIFRDSYCIFDYSYFGQILFRVYFRGAYVSSDEKKSIIERLSLNPYVLSIYEFTGEYDLTVEFASPNPSRFNKELRNLCFSIPTLNDYRVILNLVTYLCPRSYLYPNLPAEMIRSEIIIGGDREKLDFDEKELRLIRVFQEKPLSKMTTISKASGINTKTAKSILRSLEKREVIKGFRNRLDLNRLEIGEARLFIYLHNPNPEREAKLLSHLLGLKETVKISKTVGEWNMEVDLESSDSTRIRFIILNLREKFKDLIARSGIIELYDYYLIRYLPGNVFLQPDAH